MGAVREKGTLMDVKTTRDWGVFFLGIAFIITGFIFFLMPNISLVALATVAGAWLIVMGAFNIYEYARYRDELGFTGWDLAYGICSAILGIVFLIHPIIAASVIPWVAGVFMAAYGIFQIVAGVQMKGVDGRGWLIATGIISVLCALTFFAVPSMFAIFLAVFMVMQGASMSVAGLTSTVTTYDTTGHHHAA